VQLELSDFNTTEIEECFDPIFIDPGRTHAYTSIQGDNDFRRLSTKEYYDMSGAKKRNSDMQQKKRQEEIDQLESNIPSPKTVNLNNYNNHLNYIHQHYSTLFNFYNIHSAKPRMKNYISKQKALDEAVNILINGGRKYNKNNRNKNKRNKKNTNMNRRERNRKNGGHDEPTYNKKSG